VGGASRAAQDVVPFAKASGNPLRIYGLNTVGLTRQGIPSETREILKKAFRLLFRSGLNTTQALGRLKNDLPQLPEIQYLIRFVEATKRGITK
jgi:UDP-N-acetylglucosamine acyltransferase